MLVGATALVGFAALGFAGGVLGAAFAAVLTLENRLQGV